MFLWHDVQTVFGTQPTRFPGRVGWGGGNATGAWGWWVPFMCCQVAEHTPYLRMSHGASDTSIAVSVSYISRVSINKPYNLRAQRIGLRIVTLPFCNCYQIKDVRYNLVLSFIYSFTHHSYGYVSIWGSFWRPHSAIDANYEYILWYAIIGEWSMWMFMRPWEWTWVCNMPVSMKSE
jgi:hypothetical protein